MSAALRRLPVAVLAGLALVAGLSLALRTQALDAKFWIDEGLSVGISSHGFFDIPGVLRQDGSPPLYYLLLHLWIEVVGDGEERTHALSLLFALTTIPVGFLAGRAIAGVRTGWAVAALAAFNPYLTYYAQETRMYALVALLSLATCATFALAYGARRRGAIPLFVACAAALAYAHNWGLFLLVGCAGAVVVLALQDDREGRRALLRDGVLGFGALGVVYLPWIPSLLFQAAHTGAPWAERPGFDAVINGLGGLIGGEGSGILGVFVGLAGLGVVLRRPGARRDPTARAIKAIALAGGLGLLVAFLASQASPAWASRYFATFVGPVLLLLGIGLARYGRLGLMALLVVLLLWTDGRERQLRGKSDAYRVARTLEESHYVRDGDVVLSTHPEQGPLMRYYLGDGLRWADALGWVPDPQVFDWRDALERLEETGPIAVSREVLPQLETGQHLLLIQPIIRTSQWRAPWTRLVRKRAAQWERALDHTGGLRRVEALPKFEDRRLPRGVRAVVYRRTARPLVLPPPPPPAAVEVRAPARPSTEGPFQRP